MAKRHVYTGLYSRTRAKMSLRVPSATPASPPNVPLATTLTIFTEWEQLAKNAGHYIWTIYCAMTGNYIYIVTVLVVILLSLLLPDLSQKTHATQELKCMKKVLNKMSDDVKRAEVACLTVADEICCLHCTMHDDTTETSRDKMRDLGVCTGNCMQTTQSEPVHGEKEIGFFRRIFFPNRNASHKEITIMSYVYTDSFDAKKAVNSNSKI